MHETNFSSEKNYEKQLLQYWQETLKNIPQTPPLPPHSINNHHQQKEQQALQLSPLLREQIETLSLQEGVSSYVILFTAFLVLLYRYTEQNDIIISTTVTSRDLGGVEDNPSDLVSKLPVRIDLSGFPTFKDQLQRVQETILHAYKYREIDIEDLLQLVTNSDDESATEKNCHSLFSIIFHSSISDVEPANDHKARKTSLGDVRATDYANFEVLIDRSEETLDIIAIYDSNLFVYDMIQRFLNHFQTLLEAVCEYVEQPLERFTLLTPSEYDQLIFFWNDTQANDAQNVGLHELFAAQVEQTPDKIAVLYEEECLSYQEIDERTNQLAHYLQTQGVRTEVPVAVFMERSLFSFIAILAILKAGGVYVPLDPDHPSAHIAHILADVKAHVLLTLQEYIEQLPAHQAQIICLDSDYPAFSSLDRFAPQTHLTPENLYCYLYTSGSTGRPKGVAIEQRLFLNRFHWLWHTYPLRENEMSVQRTSMSHMPSIWEFLGPLLKGIPTVVLPNSITKDVSRLIKELEVRGVTRIGVVPSLLQVLLDSQEDIAARLFHIKIWMCTGEKLLRDSIRYFYARLPHATLINEYGTTEIYDMATYDTKQLAEDEEFVPVGFPIDNMQIYILDSSLNPLPIDVQGEICIGYEMAARGYNNLPAITAEKFVPHPFSKKPGARLYRTGDTARRLASGQIEYIGRVDHLVKIRGNRVEMAGVEVALRRHPAINQVAVVARENKAGEKYLVAYVVAQKAAKIRLSDLYKFLKGHLPDFMIPAVFVQIDAIPLTASGKLNRPALPAPSTIRPMLDVPYTAPYTELETSLVRIWESILNIQQIGVEDNFFFLGGHSLHATQILSHLRDHFHIEVTLPQFLDQPTIAHLTQVVEKMQTSSSRIVAPPITPAIAGEHLLLSFSQQRLWFMDRLASENPFYNVPICFSLEGNLSLPALKQSLQEIVRRHAALRTTFRVEQGIPVQVIAPSSQSHDIALPLLDLSHLSMKDSEAEVHRLVWDESRRPFDLSQDLMLRGILLRQTASTYTLLLVIHHIAFDGWSMGIMYQELSTFYTTLVQGLSPVMATLPALPIQYADFAQWQRNRLSDDVLKPHLRYWSQQLSHLPELMLPTDHPRPAVQTFRGAMQVFQCSPELLKNLKALSQAEGTTLFMTLLTAFQVLLYRYSQQEDIVVGTRAASRTHKEVEGLIGFFINSLVLRTDLSGNPTFREALARVRRVTLDAYTHQEVPFDKLVEALQPERSLGYSPLFQVMFVLHNFALPDIQMPAMRVKPVDIDAGIAPYDLDFSFYEREGGLVGLLLYATDLFEAQTISRLLEHYHILLESIIAYPTRTISTLAFLSSQEQSWLIAQGKGLRAKHNLDNNLSQFFEWQVAHTPDAIAAMCEGQYLTYQAFHERSNQLAHYLQFHAVGPEVAVGVLLDRSLSTLIALMAILKAGGIYVPLDPSYPIAHIQAVLDDIQPRLVLTDQAHVHILLAHEATSYVCLDSDAFDQQPLTSPTNRAVPENLFFIMYTSGSTGKPKGVAVEQKQLLNRLQWLWRLYPYQEGEIAAQRTTINSTLSITEILSPLLQGIPIVILPDHISKDVHRLIIALQHYNVSRVVLVPSLLRVILESKYTAQLKNVHRWTVAGEALPYELVQHFYEKLPSAVLLNQYGSSELSDVASNPTGLHTEEKTNARLGRVADNLQVYVLDTSFQQVPVGTPGELYVASIAPARAYIHQPVMTAERFLPDPYSDVPGRRLYKTGDVAQILADGGILYLGRQDHQVKIRGLRVDLQGIEAVLREHQLVVQAVASTYADLAAEKRIAAYVVTKNNEAVSAQSLRTFLQEQLPDFMIPSAFIHLDTLPLTPNGKINRLALPAPSIQDNKEGNAYRAPKTFIEKTLAEMWAEILNVQQVGINDNFFALGGHSLKAAQIVLRLSEVFQIDIPISLLFEATTIAELAASLQTKFEEDEDLKQVLATLEMLDDEEEENAF